MNHRKKPNTDKKTPQRGPGRPKKADRPVTPEVLEEIGRMYLNGKSDREIGLAIGLSHSTVQHHIEHTVKPLWRNRIQWESSIQVAKAELLYKLALEAYERSLVDCDAARASLAKAAKKGPKATADDVAKAIAVFAVRPDVACLAIAARMLDFVAKVKGGYAPSGLLI